jgi:hypothetical protein
MKPVLKAPGTERLKQKYDELLSKFAFKFNLRRYGTEDPSEHYGLLAFWVRPANLGEVWVTVLTKYVYAGCSGFALLCVFIYDIERQAHARNMLAQDVLS